MLPFRGPHDSNFGSARLERFYRRRHKIENYFGRIKDWRRIATRYDKLARNVLAAAALVGALYWIKLRVQT